MVDALSSDIQAIANDDGETDVDANEEFLSADLTPRVPSGQGSKYRITISTTLSCVFSVSLDSGSNYLAMNSGNQILAGKVYTFDLPVRNGDLVTFKQDTDNNVLTIFRVDEIMFEG